MSSVLTRLTKQQPPGGLSAEGPYPAQCRDGVGLGGRPERSALCGVPGVQKSLSDWALKTSLCRYSEGRSGHRVDPRPAPERISQWPRVPIRCDYFEDIPNVQSR